MGKPVDSSNLITDYKPTSVRVNSTPTQAAPHKAGILKGKGRKSYIYWFKCVAPDYYLYVTEIRGIFSDKRVVISLSSLLGYSGVQNLMSLCLKNKKNHRFIKHDQ